MSDEIRRKPIELPCGIDAAVRRLHRAMRRDGVHGIQLSMPLDGAVHMSLFDADERQTFVEFDNGKTYEIILTDDF